MGDKDRQSHANRRRERKGQRVVRVNELLKLKGRTDGTGKRGAGIAIWFYPANVRRRIAGSYAAAYPFSLLTRTYAYLQAECDALYSLSARPRHSCAEELVEVRRCGVFSPLRR